MRQTHHTRLLVIGGTGTAADLTITRVRSTAALYDTVTINVTSRCL